MHMHPNELDPVTAEDVQGAGLFLAFVFAAILAGIFGLCMVAMWTIFQ